MKVGVISFFPWRIHREQGLIITRLLEDEGHAVFHLECGGSSHQCYNKLLKQEGNLWGCAKCKLGSIDHLKKQNKSKFSDYSTNYDMSLHPAISEKVLSSALSINRFENSETSLSKVSETVEALTPLTLQAFEVTKAWALEKSLDAVFVFNGRMDILRGSFDAIRSLGIKVFSFERTWFGGGIQCLADEDCLGTRKIAKDLHYWMQHALTREQALKAAALISSRLRHEPNNEWRNFGIKMKGKSDVQDEFSLLVLPSSLGEVSSHLDWRMDWEDQIEGFDQVIRKLGLLPSQVVVRGHPIWAQKIGSYEATHLDSTFDDWCSSKGFRYIRPGEDIDTIELIKRSRTVLVSVSSAAVEAAVLGIPVISICRGQFTEAGFAKGIFGFSDLLHLENIPRITNNNSSVMEENAKLALRFIYYMAYRLPLLPNQLKLIGGNHYSELPDLGSSLMTDILVTGEVPIADQEHNSKDSGFELEVINLLRSFVPIKSYPANFSGLRAVSYNKALFARMIYKFRSLLKVGDQ